MSGCIRMRRGEWGFQACREGGAPKAYPCYALLTNPPYALGMTNPHFISPFRVPLIAVPHSMRMIDQISEISA
jgi:hypothetical protein